MEALQVLQTVLAVSADTVEEVSRLMWNDVFGVLLEGDTLKPLQSLSLFLLSNLCLKELLVRDSHALVTLLKDLVLSRGHIGSHTNDL